MSQHDFQTINPASYGGTDLANDLNPWVQSVISNHSGASRPSYLLTGGAWYDTANSQLKLYNGTTDLIIASGDITTFGIQLIESADAAAVRALISCAPLASPAFTGSPTAPTQTAGDNSTKLATTAYVDASGGGGVVKQIKRLSPALTSTVSVSSTSFAAVSGLAAPAITMSDSANKIRVTAFITGGSPTDNVPLQLQVYRDGSPILQGDAAGSRTRTQAVFTKPNSGEALLDSTTIVFTDEPGDTSAHTYQVYARVQSGTGYINKTSFDADNAGYSRGVSTIEVMEVTE